MADFEHLAKPTIEALSKSKQERLLFTKQRRWIPYERAKRILEDLQDIVESPRVTRMPCRLIVSPSNNGKTTIAERFVSSCGLKHDATQGKTTAPVVFVRALTGPDILQFYRLLLEDLGVGYHRREDEADLRARFDDLISELEIMMLILDEANAISVGNKTEQAAFLRELHALTTRSRISLVAFGTQTAGNIFSYGEEFRNRFEPFHLPTWNAEPDEDGYVEVEDVLAKIEATIPLPRPSHLADHASELLAQSDGILGDLSDLVRKMAMRAIQQDKEYMPMSLIKEIAWVRPSQRFLKAAG